MRKYLPGTWHSEYERPLYVWEAPRDSIYYDRYLEQQERNASLVALKERASYEEKNYWKPREIAEQLRSQNENASHS